MKSQTYMYYYKNANGKYQVSGFTKQFKTVAELKAYYNRYSALPVKFIKV